METKGDSDMKTQPKYDAYILDIHLANSKCQKMFGTRYRHAYQIVWQDTLGVSSNDDSEYYRPFNTIERNPTNKIRFWWDDRIKNPPVEIWMNDNESIDNKRIVLFRKTIGKDKFLLGNELNEKIMDMDLRGDRYKMVDVHFEKIPHKRSDEQFET